MRLLLLLLCSFTPLLTTAAPTSIPPGNFSLSCTAIDLSHNFFLGATCCHPTAAPDSSPDDGPVEAQSDNQLDLTMCIGLNQVSGHMQWEVYGKFSNYCTNCTVLAAQGQREHLLTCFCEPLVGARGPVKSTINLDEGITNDMGTLKCAGGVAEGGRGGGGH